MIRAKVDCVVPDGRAAPAANPAIVRQIQEMDDRREPSGQRFVILRHDMPKAALRPSHWDLMLEFDGVLLTWELPTLAFEGLPDSFKGLNIRRLADHRLAYLSYEGPVSNHRGDVQRIDAGFFEVLDASESWVRVQATGAVWQIEMRLPKAVLSDSNTCPMDEDATEDAATSGELLRFDAIH